MALRLTRSLRRRALLAIVLPLVAPVIWVWSTSTWEGVGMWIQRHDLVATATVVARRLRARTLDVDRMARTHRVRIRLLDAGGKTIDDADHEGRPTVIERPIRVFHLLIGQDEPDLRALDRSRGPLWERPVFREARRAGWAVRCTSPREHPVRTCAYAGSIEVPGQPVRWFHVQSSTLRAPPLLVANRLALLELLLYNVSIALPLSGWLIVGWVRPLERLRDQALERAERLHLEPLEADQPDEFGELAQAFNRLLEALAHQQNAQEALIGELAHELKNPVAALQTVADALERASDPEQRARMRRIMDRSLARMDTVIRQVLQLAEAEAGLAQVPRARFDLAACVCERVAHLRAERDTLHIDLVTEPCMMVGSADRLGTAIHNLLTNAASFASNRIEIRLRQLPDRAELHISDDGPGIAPDDLPRIFEPHFSRRRGGTGLGLALSRAIVRAHGGSLRAENRPEGGARFILELPR